MSRAGEWHLTCDEEEQRLVFTIFQDDHAAQIDYPEIVRITNWYGTKVYTGCAPQGGLDYTLVKSTERPTVVAPVDRGVDEVVDPLTGLTSQQMIERDQRAQQESSSAWVGWLIAGAMLIVVGGYAWREWQQGRFRGRPG